MSELRGKDADEEEEGEEEDDERLTVEDAIRVTRSTPFLMREHVATDRLLLLLDQLDVRLHALGFESFRELGCFQNGRSQRSGKRGDSLSLSLSLSISLFLSFSLTSRDGSAV